MRDPPEVKRVMGYFDEDGDGQVSVEGLWKMGVGILMKEAEVAIRAMDSDGDGFLSVEDLVGLMERVGEEEKLEDLREAFKMYDVVKGLTS